MKIQDIAGDELRLLEDRVQETRSQVSAHPYHAFLADIKKAKEGEKNSIRIHGRFLDGEKSSVIVPFSSKGGKIGCRTFSPATFAKILKAAGVKPKPVRKTNKRKVAR